MKNSITTLLLASTVALVGCGDSESTVPKTAEKPEATKPVKFKGAKYAPSQDVINQTVANEWFDRKGGYNRVKKDNQDACKGTASYLPDQWPAACASAMTAWKNGIAFTPNECRNGDERDGYSGELINPVSCTGLLEDPTGEEKHIFVFHKPDGEWKAWIGPSFPGSRKNRN